MQLPVIVIGAGPAGLMAATESALNGCHTILLEKMPRPGRKLLITGNGRCNVTNSCDPANLQDYFFSGAKFLRSAFSRFNNRDLAAMLRNGGLPLIEEPAGKLFPASSKAADVLDFLLRRAESAGVRILTSTSVTEIIVEYSQAALNAEAETAEAKASGVQIPRVTGVRTSHGIMPAGAVVLAAGGRSWPHTGSNGDGTRLAATAGHTVAAERPALAPLILADQEFRQLQGLALQSVAIQLKVGGSIIGRNRGDMLFTHFGVSGPAILRLSRLLSEPWPDKKVQLLIDFLPDLDRATLDRQLLEMLAAEPRRQLHNSLTRYLPAAFTPHLLRLADLPPDLMNGRITGAQRLQLLEKLKSLPLQITGSRGWREAIVTAGGVNLKEINPRTMASRLISGLFLAGEVLDIDADTGGFNLQAAWSTGWLAGRSAAAYTLRTAAEPAILV